MHYAYEWMSILLIYHPFCRQRAATKAQGDGARRNRTRAVRAIPAPDANAELQSNVDVCLLVA